jgi:hypothetical protein
MRSQHDSDRAGFAPTLKAPIQSDKLVKRRQILPRSARMQNLSNAIESPLLVCIRHCHDDPFLLGSSGINL